MAEMATDTGQHAYSIDKRFPDQGRTRPLLRSAERKGLPRQHRHSARQLTIHLPAHPRSDALSDELAAGAKALVLHFAQAARAPVQQ